jgi:hypothetical protein
VGSMWRNETAQFIYLRGPGWPAELDTARAAGARAAATGCERFEILLDDLGRMPADGYAGLRALERGLAAAGVQLRVASASGARHFAPQDLAPLIT